MKVDIIWFICPFIHYIVMQNVEEMGYNNVSKTTKLKVSCRLSIILWSSSLSS